MACGLVSVLASFWTCAVFGSTVSANRLRLSGWRPTGHDVPGHGRRAVSGLLEGRISDRRPSGALLRRRHHGRGGERRRAHEGARGQRAAAEGTAALEKQAGRRGPQGNRPDQAEGDPLPERANREANLSGDRRHRDGAGHAGRRCGAGTAGDPRRNAQGDLEPAPLLRGPASRIPEAGTRDRRGRARSLGAELSSRAHDGHYAAGGGQRADHTP